jgi:hypothetical protein
MFISMYCKTNHWKYDLTLLDVYIMLINSFFVQKNQAALGNIDKSVNLNKA